MKYMLLAGYLVFFCLPGVVAQQRTYENIDAFTEKTGSLDTLNVARIAGTLTGPFEKKEDKLRAIFYWISHNIVPDLKATKANDNKNILPEWVIKNRKATPMGYATLFQEMSSMAGIRCLIVDGYLKRNAEDIGNKPDDLNFAWNVVQLGQSPEKWFYVDVASASGIINKKFTAVEPYFVSEYFFTDKKLFNLDHYPNNSAWLLGPGAKNVKEFYAQPVISPAAYSFGLQSLSPEQGSLKFKLNKQVNFRYAISGDSTINSVTLVTGENSRQMKSEPMNFDVSSGKLVFDFEFKKEDSFPMTILVNGRNFLMYQVEIIE